MIQRDTIFTNVAADCRTTALVGKDSMPELRHRTGRASHTLRAAGPAAHPNSRFTVSGQAQSDLLVAGGSTRSVPSQRSCSAVDAAEVAPLVY